MKLFILAVLCSIAALTWGESDVKDTSSLIKGNSALNDVKDASSLNKGNSALDDVKGAARKIDETRSELGFEPRSDVLLQGYELGFGQGLISQNKRFTLIMQQDGNLVLYKTAEWRAIWATSTVGQGGVKTALQYDGNFVMYTALKFPKWASGTNGLRPCHLILQDDGNLVIYGDGNKIYWASGTNGRMQKVTNLSAESLNSTSVVNVGATTRQEVMPPTLNGSVDFGKDSVSAPVPDRTLDGIN